MKHHSERNHVIAFVCILSFLLIISFSTAYGQTKPGRQQAPVKSLPALIDIGAKKCIPCKMMAPILEELQKDYSESIKVKFIDVWENPGAGEQYRIRGIPTQIFYDASGRELGRHMGFISKDQIIGAFKEFGIEVKKNQPKRKK